MPEVIIPLLIITLTTLVSLAPIYFIFRSGRKNYEKTKHKISDAEIFQLMARANHFLTDEQLAAVSPLTKKEAKSRLYYLSMHQVIRQLGSGFLTVFQLKEDIPLSKNLPISPNGRTEQQIIDIILEYSEDYQITIAELVVIFGISIREAKALLKRLKKSKLVSSLWSSKGIINAINSPLQNKQPKIKIANWKSQTPKINIEAIDKIKIPDSDVIGLAIQHKGKFTPSLVCLKLKIPIAAATEKLDQLYDQGAFVMDMNPKNAVVEYHLRDKNLLD